MFMKKKLTRLLTAAAMLFSLGIALYSCKKESDKKQNNDQPEALQLSVANNIAETAYDDAFNVVLQDGQTNNVAGRGNSCATVTLSNTEPNVFPKTMTIDFGTGCTSNDGVTRMGKITATLSGKIRTAGTTIAVTFENYIVNGFKVEGTLTITNNSGQSGLGFTTQTTNGKLTYPDGTTFYTHTGTHTLTQTAGAGTVTFADDSFSLTGNGTTTSSAGNSLTVNITTPLVKNATCDNFSAGVQEFTYNTISGSLNYGDGTCDNIAKLTIGAYSQDITLPR
jgi:hypothetical protein